MGVLTIIMGIVLAICGVFCIFTPFATFAVFFQLMGLIAGVSLLFIGIVKIVGYFTDHDTGRVTGWDLFAGILTTIFGILIISDYYMRLLLESLLFWVIIGWLIIVGILKIVSSFTLKKEGINFWGFVLVMGILSLLIGIFALFNTFAFVVAEGWLIALFIITEGFNMISAGCVMCSNKKK